MLCIDVEADLEACKMLTTNAENLTSAISKALYHTHSASIRVDETTRKELGLLSTTRAEQHDVWFDAKVHTFSTIFYSMQISIDICYAGETHIPIKSSDLVYNNDRSEHCR